MQLPDPLPRNLNLGCGYDHRPGFLNVDSDPASGPDFIADVASLPMLPSGHFDHIVAHDVLEHISRTKTDEVLEEWARLLAPAGHMFVRVPSLQHLAALTLADGYQDADHAEGIIHLLFGTQAQTGDYHLTSFTRATLVRHFARVGLHVVSVTLMDGWMYDMEMSRAPAAEPVVWPAVKSLADAVPDVSARLAAMPRASAELAGMRQSASWRITAPLKMLRPLIYALRSMLGVNGLAAGMQELASQNLERLSRTEEALQAERSRADAAEADRGAAEARADRAEQAVAGEGEQLMQVLLRQQYRAFADRGRSQPDFAEVEFRCHSQNGEDGILFYIFSLIGATSRKALEICAGDGIECNSANLILNHGFSGLLFDGNAEQIERGRAFYAAHPNTRIWPPQLVATWITAETINDQVAMHGVAGDIDLLSLDLDGNDYWVWKALTVVRPRVVVLEFNASCGPEVAAAMSYRPDYRLDYGVTPYRCGASLAAFVKLGRAKGYRLVGIQRLGFNAFFIREDIGTDLLPEVTAAQLYARHGPKDWSAEADAIMSGAEPWELV